MINKKIFLGLMSGTSMDGLDICLSELSIDDDFNLKFKIIGSDVAIYKPNIRKKLLGIVSNQDSLESRGHQVGMIYLDLIKNHNLVLNNNLDGISIHGQTVSHIDSVISIQLGHPKPLFDYFKVPIYFNFRDGDIKLNGNGAPLVPFLDFLLYKNNPIDVLSINLGGISNITFVPFNTNKREEVIGFDVGPGMYLINKFMREFYDQELDLNGNFSRIGNINEKLLLNLKNCSFIKRNPPKSIHTDHYDLLYNKIMSKKYYKLSKEDTLRTLVYFTAYCISENIKDFIQFKTEKVLVYLNGGGCNHPIVVSDINKLLMRHHKTHFFLKRDRRINSDTKESFLMCVLGFSRFKNLFSNMPNVTGASGSTSLGEVYDS